MRTWSRQTAGGTRCAWDEVRTRTPGGPANSSTSPHGCGWTRSPAGGSARRWASAASGVSGETAPACSPRTPCRASGVAATAASHADAAAATHRRPGSSPGTTANRFTQTAPCTPAAYPAATAHHSTNRLAVSVIAPNPASQSSSAVRTRRRSAVRTAASSSAAANAAFPWIIQGRIGRHSIRSCTAGDAPRSAAARNSRGPAGFRQTPAAAAISERFARRNRRLRSSAAGDTPRRSRSPAAPAACPSSRARPAVHDPCRFAQAANSSPTVHNSHRRPGRVTPRSSAAKQTSPTVCGRSICGDSHAGRANSCIHATARNTAAPRTPAVTDRVRRCTAVPSSHAAAVSNAAPATRRPSTPATRHTPHPPTCVSQAKCVIGTPSASGISGSVAGSRPCVTIHRPYARCPHRSAWYSGHHAI